MEAYQLPLFADEAVEDRYEPPVTSLSETSGLSVAMEGFHDYMIEQNFTQNTIKSFLADLRLLKEYAGPDKPLAQIDTEELRNFLHYLQHERGVPCTPKSLARRLTTLKVFFGWLAEDGTLPLDPAASIAHQRAESPLPEILNDKQVAELLTATRSLLEDVKKPDARPHLLATLLLHTGLKKSECMSIKLSHIDSSDRSSVSIYVRYDDPKQSHKEREVALPEEFASTLESYLAEYQPQDHLFECTARNLEYVLSAAAELAGLEDISFEALRLTCAVRDYKRGMPSDELREKLGLSTVTWRAKEKQIQALAETPLQEPPSTHGSSGK